MGGDQGYFIEPTILDDVRDEMKVAREEIFGPVMSHPALRRSGRSDRAREPHDLGIAAAVWTRDVSQAHRVAAALKAGMVRLNCYDAFDGAAPFGGLQAKRHRPRTRRIRASPR